MKDYQKYIRNFSIIAHIDHGKSTLADRIIEKTGLVSKREMREQFLDNMELERERGITIKLQTTRLIFHSKDGNEYIFNLIDTPGHVDFTYEVSRSLAACEGAVLVVDATQGVEAQTLANVYLAMDEDLEIMPVLNKIDLPSARPEEIKQEIEDVIGVDAEDAPLVSAKEGIGVEELLERIVTDIPAPQGDEHGKLKALIFDSYYDNYKGVVIYTRVFDGTVKEGDIIRLMNTDKKYEVTEVGVYSPGPVECKSLRAGEVGYICASIKKVSDARVGDTITIDSDPTEEALPGYKKVQPMVYCGIYPAEGEKYENVKDALEKLQVNDAAFHFEPETSTALGFGFRCGFLGLLHMEIIVERLEREFDLAVVTTSPSVIYKVVMNDGSIEMVQNPSNLPDLTADRPHRRTDGKGRYHGAEGICGQYYGDLPGTSRQDASYGIHHAKTESICIMKCRLNEVIYDFFDALKSKTRGYGSLDYEFVRYEPSKVVKLDILLNKDLVDAFSMIVHESKAYSQRKIRMFQAEGDHPDASVRGADSGFHRTEGHRPRDGAAHTEKMLLQSVTEEIFRERKSCWKSRRKGKSECVSSAR